MRRIFKTRYFSRWMRKTDLTDKALCAAVSEMETGLIEWLPEHDPHVAAFRSLFDELPGAVNQELIWLELDGAKASPQGVRSILDPAALLAQEELVRYLEARVPEIRGQFGVLPLLLTTKSLLPGAGAADPSLPRSPLWLEVLWGALEASRMRRDSCRRRWRAISGKRIVRRSQNSPSNKKTKSSRCTCDRAGLSGDRRRASVAVCVGVSG